MEAKKHFEGKLRIRVCGLLKVDERLLLVRLRSPITKQQIWIPPGGGVEFGESLEIALQREFFEETGLEIEVVKLRHINELIEDSIHAIEFYFDVQQKGGILKLGFDPEYDGKHQLIEELGFFGEFELSKLNVAPDFIRTSYWQEAGISLSRNGQ